MAKRKRNTDESTEENVVDKKSKRDHNQRESKHNTSSSTAGPNDNPPVMTSPSTQPKIAAANTARAGLKPGVPGSHVDIPAAPPGLSKGQRKRWRKRQRLAAIQAQQPQLKRETFYKSGSRNLETSAGSKQSSKPTLDQSALRSFGTTQLMPRRRKLWHEDAPAQAAESGITPKAKLPETQHTGARVEISIGDDEDAESIRRERSGPEPDSDPDDSRSSRSSATSADAGPGGSFEHATDRIAKKQVMSGKIQGTNTVRLQSHQVTAASVRSTSFGNRATSVPSFANSSDPVESFKRFSAWLHKGDSDSEDSGSEDADSENQIAGETGTTDGPTIPTEGATIPPDGADESILPVTAGPEDPSQDGQDDKVQSPNFVRPMSSDEVDVDQLPRFSDSAAPITPGNGSTWPANVGIKRQMSFLGQELGGTPYGSGVGLDSEPNKSFHSASTNFPCDPFETNDDSQELLRTVDDISNTVFGSTRPLPASKNRESLDPGNGPRENEALTSPSSDRRMTRSMATPKESQKQRNGGNEGLLMPSTDPTTVYSQAMTQIGPEYSSVKVGDEADSDSMSSNIDVANPGSRREASRATESTSSLRELSKSPSPPAEAALLASILKMLDEPSKPSQLPDIDRESEIDEAGNSSRKKRKMTGRTSKHFTPIKETRQRKPTTREFEDANGLASDGRTDAQVENVADVDVQPAQLAEQNGTEKPKRRTRASSKIVDTQQEEAWNRTPEQLQIEEKPWPVNSTRSAAKKRKSTGKRSSYFTPSKPALDPEIIDRVDFYNTTASAKKARVPAGISIAPVPPITAERFGIIQEKLWREPFWLLIAVTFLNKTTGRAAVPVFWALKEKFATPGALAEAEQDELCEMIHHLGLQNQRAKRMISMAQAWMEQEPVKGRRTRTLHYPAKNDGKEFKRNEIVEEDADDCTGALEIGHIPGCGPYAWDSWRIFCRDVLRGVADDYKGAGASDEFEPEWKKVLPGDKELRACLRWMWLREGWIWDHETGEKRRATEVEMQKALQGEMEINDPQERKFAAQAAGVEVSPTKADDNEIDASISKSINNDPETPSAAKKPQPRTPEPSQTVVDEDEADTIIVTPVISPATRKRRHRPSVRG